MGGPGGAASRDLSRCPLIIYIHWCLRDSEALWLIKQISCLTVKIKVAESKAARLSLQLSQGCACYESREIRGPAWAPDVALIPTGANRLTSKFCKTPPLHSTESHSGMDAISFLAALHVQTLLLCRVIYFPPLHFSQLAAPPVARHQFWLLQHQRQTKDTAKVMNTKCPN